METTVFTGRGADMNLLREIAKRLRIDAQTLSDREAKDLVLARKIQTSFESGTVSRNAVMRVLNKS